MPSVDPAWMRLLLPLLSILASCAGPLGGGPSQAQSALAAPAHAIADSTTPDLLKAQEPPLVSAVRNGPDGRSLIMGLWGDGRMVSSIDAVSLLFASIASCSRSRSAASCSSMSFIWRIMASWEMGGALST